MAEIYGETGSRHWRAWLSYDIVETATKYTVKVTGAGMQSVGYGFQITYNTISTTVSCGGKTASGSGDFYSPNGATVATSYVTADFEFDKTTTSQSVVLSVSTTNASGFMSGTSAASVTLSIPALKTFTVAYDANGGTGAPSQQVKSQGHALVLSSTVPTRNGYTFVGWGLSASSTASTVAYQPGQSYSADADLLLYAVWETKYIAPSISGVRAFRCDSSGNPAGDGAYAKVSCSWSVDTTMSPSNVAKSVKVELRESASDKWEEAYVSNPGTSSGTLETVVGGGSLAADKAYLVKVTVTDANRPVSATASVPKVAAALSFGRQGRSAGVFTKASSDRDGLDVDGVVRFLQGVYLHDSDVPLHERLGGGSAPGAAYIADYGTSGTWEYLILSNGVAACWKSFDADGKAFENAYGNGWFISFESTLPFEFEKTPYSLVSVRTDSGGLMGSSFNDSCNAGRLGFYVFSLKHEASLNLRVQLLAFGKKKA